MTPTIEDLSRAIEGSNPFRRNRVSDPSSADTDETSIHEREYKRLLEYIEATGRDVGSTGVLIVGQAGVGKSHVLARLFGWSREQQVTMVFLHNVLASPERMPRYVLHATVSALAGNPGSYAESRLYRLLNIAIRRVLPQGKKKGRPSMPDRLAALTALGRKYDPKDRVIPVLKAFVEYAAPSAEDGEATSSIAEGAVEWLSGETIEPELAVALGLGANPERVRLPDDDAIRNVFHVLAALAADKPLVVCIDQVDNLDEDKVVALTSFLHALLDHCKNLVVLLSGVKESMYRFRDTRVIPEAAWDRVAEHKIELAKLHRDEARLLIRKRVEVVMKPFAEIGELGALIAKDDLFPVGSAWFAQRLDGQIEVRARDVVSWAREAWDDERARLREIGIRKWLSAWPVETTATRDSGGFDEKAAIDHVAATKVKERVTERTLDPGALPPNADNWKTLAEAILRRCAGDKRYTLRSIGPSEKTAYDLFALERATDDREVDNGILFLSASNANGATAALKRVTQDSSPPQHRYLVTDEGRRPIKLGAVGRKTYDALNALGDARFQHIKLSFHDHAELDAFEGVMRAARVGDLEIDNGVGTARTVSEEEVGESLHRQGFFLKHPLLRHLLTEEAAPGSPRPKDEPFKIDRQRARETVMGYLSWRIGMTTRELTQIYVELESKRKGARPLDPESVRAQLVVIVDEMHREGLVYVTAQDDDRFLQLSSKGSGKKKT